jgi:protein TonB
VHTQIASTQVVSLRPMFRPSFTPPSRIPTKISDAGPEPMPFMPQSAGIGTYKDPLAGVFETPKEAPIQAAPATAATPKTPIRVSVGVQAAKLIRQVKPTYPQMARIARMSGTVRLQAIIATDGRIRNLQLIGGPPLLVAAALDAVKQWQYEPTLLNGEPVEVITSIEVNFTLNQ